MRVDPVRHGLMDDTQMPRNPAQAHTIHVPLQRQPSLLVAIATRFRLRRVSALAKVEEIALPARCLVANLELAVSAGR